MAKIAKIPKMDGKSLSPQKELGELLRKQFPQVFAEGKVNPDKLKQALGEELDTNNERYGLSWAGKAECFRHIQETTTATLKPIKSESVDFDKTENIFIEGDNLEVLKILQKTYQNSIKMIYIDPPYNTGNDSFIYPDRFQEERNGYEERAGIRDEEGLLTKDGFWRKNSQDAGHFHSNWLSMMYPRLFLAKNLLREDGVIFVSIDDNEVHNLRMIMNEIFGEENFVAEIVWQKRKGGGNDSAFVAIDHEAILLYCRNKDSHINTWRVPYNEEYLKRYKEEDEGGKFYWDTLSRSGLQSPIVYDVKCPDGSLIRKGEWQISQNTFKEKLQKGEITFIKNKKGGWTVLHKVRLPNGKVFRSVFRNYTNTDSAKEMISIFDSTKYYDNPKPTGLIKELMSINCNNNDDDIILDFFAGSCTTAHAVMALNAEDGGNRKFICVQLAEPCEEESEAYKAGFKTIADIGKERIRRAGKKIKAEAKGKLDFDGKKLDLGFKVFRLEESNFKQWRENIKEPEEFKKQLWEMVDNVKKGAAGDDMLFEIILKNSRFDLNVATEKRNYDGVEYYVLATEHTETTEKIKAGSGNKKIHHEEKEGREGKTNANEIICLDSKITKKLVDKVLAEKPERFTCLDAAFKNNDQLKTNTALQMESAKIEFKVI